MDAEPGAPCGIPGKDLTAEQGKMRGWLHENRPSESGQSVPESRNVGA
jgi:hypothetical protein